MKNSHFFFLALIILVLSGCARSDDQPQWGERYTRNMVSDESGLPESFDPESGENFKWQVVLGSQTYSTPVISQGKIFLGTNNDNPRNEQHQGDRGVLYCLDETSGKLLWQLIVPKLSSDRYLDWPKEGIVSPATGENDRVYIVSNRGEVMCLDIHGLSDGNDGSYQSEAKHMIPDREHEPVELTNIDADILWLYDLRSQSGVYQHDAAHASILLVGDLLYLNTSNGVDNTHAVIRAPDAPSLVVLDKNTGELVATDREGIGPNIFHCTWSSPALARQRDRELILFAGGNGICYAFNPADPHQRNAALNKVWWYDGDLSAPKTKVHDYLRNRETSPSNIKSMPVYAHGRLFLTLGGDIWWGKRKAWLQCVDIEGRGDISASHQKWSYALNKHVCTTPSVYQNMVFVGDCGHVVHCVNAETGQPFWTHETDGDIWASTLVADGKLYVATRRGSVYVFRASEKKELLHEIRLDGAINASPVAANGVLYIATMETLFAFANP